MRNKDLTVQTDIQTIAPATISGNGDYTEGAAVDGKNASAVRHILKVGESGDTWGGSLYTDVILQHSTDNSTWAAVTSSADFIGSMETQTSGIVKVLDAEADDNANYEVTYVGPRRYSRLYLDRAGNHSSGTPMAAIAILQPRLSGSVSPS